MTAPITSAHEWAELIDGIYAVRAAAEGVRDYIDEHTGQDDEMEATDVDLNGDLDHEAYDDQRWTDLEQQQYDERRRDELDAADGRLDGRMDPSE